MPGPGGRPKLSAAKREEIVRLGREGKIVSEIASITGVSRASVNKYCKEAGVDLEEGVRGYVKAQETSAKIRSAQAKERRAIIHDRFLDEIEDLLDKLHEPVTRDYPINAAGGRVMEYVAPGPNAKETRDLMNAAGVAMTQALRLADFDTDKGVGDARNLLAGLSEAFGIAADHIEAGEGSYEPPTDEGAESPEPVGVPLEAGDEQFDRVDAENSRSKDTNYNRQLNKRTEARMAANRAERESQ